MNKNEALKLALEYMNECLEEHDAKYQRHPATEAGRNNILDDIEIIKEALAQPKPDLTEQQRESYQKGHNDGVAHHKQAVKVAQPDYRAVKTYHEGKPVYVSQPEKELVVHLNVAYKLAQKELTRLAEENFGRMPNDKWANGVLDLRDYLEAQQTEDTK